MKRAESGQPDVMLRWLIGVAVGLAILHLVLWFIWNHTGVLIVLPWSPVVVDGFSILASLAIAFVAFGRYRVLREPAPYWIGAAFTGFAVFAVFDMLTAPDLLPGGRAILTPVSGTSAWFFLSMLTALALFLLLADLVRWPHAGAQGERWWFHFVVVGIAVGALLAVLIVVNASSLPPLFIGPTWSPLQTGWKYAILALFAIGAALSAYRYRQTRDTLIGYVALTQIVFTFAAVSAIAGQTLYDVWFYWLRALWVLGFSIMLFGLLSEYAGLYRREIEISRRLRESERAIRESEERFRATFEQAAVGISHVTIDGRFVRLNQKYCDVVGYSREELLGRSFQEITYHPDVEADVSLVGQLLSGEVPGFSLEKRYIRKDGMLIWVNFTASLVRDPSGEPEYLIGVIEDISGRKTAEAERQRLLEEQVAARRRIEELAREAERRAAELRSVLDTMVEAVIVVSAERRIVLVNGAFTRMTGLDAGEVVGISPAEYAEKLRLRTSEGRAKAGEELSMSRALSGQTVTNEPAVIRNARTGRDVQIRVSAAPLRGTDDEVVGVVTVSRDVTELTELDRLKDQFISVTAHELKTPVTIMKGYAQMLLRTGTDLPPARRRMLEAIDSGANRIDRVIVELLDVSRLMVGQLEMTMGPVDLPGLVEDAVDRESLLAPRHRIRVTRATPVVVQGDRYRLDQVLVNLLDNAVLYSAGGGEIDVSVDVKDGEAVVSVEDHGVGIPKEKQARIFQRFYRAHTGTPYDYGGMGVGLYISAEIVKRHGGRIWFESEEGKGSTFHFALPV